MSLNKEKTLLEKYDIPIEHLDFKYIYDCSNIIYLEKIYKVLKSGEEGHYPDLLKCCEDKIKKINPTSKVLRTCTPIVTKNDLQTEQKQSLMNDVEEWESQMKHKENDLKQAKTSIFSDIPIREVKPEENVESKITEIVSTACTNNPNRIKSHEYDKWDKFDVDNELVNIDMEASKNSKEKVLKSNIESFGETNVDSKNWSMKDKEEFAEKEKVKGNEAYYSNQYSEAIFYYSRSINVIANVNTYNNRAQVYIKMGQHEDAINDCNKVLEIDPKNVKAKFRRGSAKKELLRFNEAEKDFEAVLRIEPNNKNAQTFLNETRQHLNKGKPQKGTKLPITQISSPSTALSKSQLKIHEDPDEIPPLEDEPGSNSDFIMREVKTKRLDPQAKSKFTLPHKLSIETVSHDTEMEQLFPAKESPKQEQQEVDNKMDIAKAKETEEARQINIVKEYQKVAEKFLDSIPTVSNSYEFYNLWQTQRVGKNSKVSSKFLRQLDIDKIPELLGNRLEGDMVFEIFQGLNELLDEGELEKTQDLLNALTKVSRIGITTLFLSKEEKGFVASVIQKCCEGQPNDRLQVLKKTFNCL